MNLDLESWKRSVPALEELDRGDALIAAADLAEMEAIRTRQAANRHKAYANRRPTRYANATYAALRHPHQDPRGMVSAWWARGPRVLILAGPSRTGKTYAAHAVANSVHAQGQWVTASSAADLSAAMKPTTRRGADGRTATTLEDPLVYTTAATADLLVVDDLGRERVTEWWLEQLQRIVDHRCAHLGRMVVTTNIGTTPQGVFAGLGERYGEPLAERLLDGGGILIFDGPANREVVTSW
jgi:DNA replication protein DnaC